MISFCSTIHNTLTYIQYSMTSPLFTQTLQFTEEKEQNNTVNYLDITIHKTLTNTNISIYRKSTFADALIPYTSNHPIQNKYAAISLLCNRLNSYQLHSEEYRHEENIFHNILHNNSYTIPPKFQKPFPSTTTKFPDKTKMVHIYIHKQREYIHYEIIQTF